MINPPSMKTGPRKRFQKVNVEISNICNLQCSFCPEVVRDKKIMDLSLFEKVVEQVAPLTEQIALHLMGEPLLHPKLPEFLDLCTKHQTPVFFTSNGSLLTDKRASLLLHPTIRQVNFSLHSFPDNYPEKDPGEYMEKIFRFTEDAFEKRPDLYINYRLWNLQDTKMSTPQNNQMHAMIEERFKVKIEPSVDVRVQKSKKLLNRLYLHFDTEFTWPALDLPLIGTKGTCYGLDSHFGILAEGTVVPCCLDKEGKIPLGDANTTPILEILESEKAKAILKGFKERKLIDPLCQRCNYVTRFN